ncbi:hypothetical protein OSTOST_22474 [Ostertagia ostertagi]
MQHLIYHFAEAVIAKNKKNSFEQFMQMINDAIIVHFDKIQGIPFGVDYLRALDADFLMGIVYQLMDYAPLVPLKAPDETLKATERILKIIIENSPGAKSRAYFILAALRYFCIRNGMQQIG